MCRCILPSQLKLVFVARKVVNAARLMALFVDVHTATAIIIIILLSVMISAPMGVIVPAVETLMAMDRTATTRMSPTINATLASRDQAAETGFMLW